MSICRSANWRRPLGSTKPSWLHAITERSRANVTNLKLSSVDFWRCPQTGRNVIAEPWQHPLHFSHVAPVSTVLQSIPEDGLKDLPMYMSPVIPMTAEEFDGSELDTFFRKVGIGTECRGHLIANVLSA